MPPRSVGAALLGNPEQSGAIDRCELTRDTFSSVRVSQHYTEARINKRGYLLFARAKPKLDNLAKIIYVAGSVAGAVKRPLYLREVASPTIGGPTPRPRPALFPASRESSTSYRTPGHPYEVVICTDSAIFLYLLAAPPVLVFSSFPGHPAPAPALI
jgi:hypothetical protein